MRKSIIWVIFVCLISIHLKSQTGAALNFDGSNDYVDLGNSALLKPTAALTAEAWVYLAAWTGTQTLFGNTQASGYEMFIGSGSLHAYVYRNGAYGIASTPLAGISSGWHHLAMTFDGQFVNLYVDAILMATNNAGGVYPIVYIGNSTLLGAEAFTSNTPEAGYYSNATFDELRIWNVARTACQIENHMNCEIPTTAAGLVANYHFNQGVAGSNNSAVTTLLDVSGSALTGTLNLMNLNGASSNWVAPGGVISGYTTAASPYIEIDVKGNGITISDGDLSPSISDFTNFDTEIDRTFIIENLGSNVLSISASTLVGADPTQFSITALPNATVAPSGTTAITVRFIPSSIGVKNATLRITNDDCNEGIYNFAIRGTGIAAEALSLIGGGDRVNLGTNPTLRPANALTAEMWVSSDNLAGNRTMISNTNGDGYSIFSNGSVVAGRVNRNGSFGVCSTTVSALNGGWHHLALTFDGRFTKFYIDGLLVDENDAAGTYTIPYSANNMWIGAEAGASLTPVGQYFIGKIDELRIWNVARTQCEIQSYMNCEIPTTAIGLLANFHFNQGIASSNNPTETTLNDVSGTVSSGTLTNIALSGTVSNWVSPGSVVSNFTTANSPLPEINFVGNGNSINSGDLSPSLTDHTDFGTASTRTFVIQNTGTQALYLHSPYITGPDATSFSVSVIPSASVAPSSSTSLVIAFSPTSTGVKTATFNVFGNDCSEPLYFFGIQGTPIPAEALNFDGANDAARTGTLSNQLYNYSMQAKVNWSGTNGFNQLIVYNGNTSTSGYGLFLPPNSNTLHVLVGGISIYSTNCVLTPSVWTSISFVAINNTSFIYLNGLLSYTFAMATPAAPTASFEIGCNNLGTENFNGTIDEVLFWSKPLSQCEILSYLNSEIPTTAPNLLGNYHFNQGADGISNATVTTIIDASGNNNHLNLTGFLLNGPSSNWIAPGAVVSGNTVVSTPSVEINISGNGNPIIDGATSTSTLNHTNFESNPTRTFVIANTGSSALYLNPYIDIVGSGVNEFSVASAIPASIAANSSIALVVAFTPTSIGTKSVVITIMSSDCDESDYDFTLSGSAQVGSALNFDGVDDFVSIPAPLDPQVGNYSLECWFKINSNLSRPTLFKHFQTTGTGRSHLYISNTFSTLASNAGGVPLLGTTTITPGQWYHAAYTWDGSTRKIYLNGVLEATNTNTLEATTGTVWRLGNNVMTNLLDGEMDEVRFWNTERSQCQIQTFMNCEIPTSAAGLVANYHFNQGLASGTNTTVTTLTDASGNSNTGSLTNFALLTGSISNWVSPGGVANGFTLSSPPTATLTLSGNGNNIPIGTLTSTLNYTDFGTNPSRTFSISNTSGTLNIGSIFFTGVNAAQFSVTTLPASSLTIGGTSFVILHTPSVIGTASAVLNIPSNDCTNPTFSFVITATTPTASSLNFDGVNDYIDLGSTSNLKPTSALTAELWANMATWTGTFALISNANAAGYAIRRNTTSNNIMARVFRNGLWEGVNYPLSSLGSGWHHFALTYDGRYINLYVDGLHAGTNDAGANYPITYSGNNTLLGAEAGVGVVPQAGFYFTGNLDEVRIWNTARTQCEIQTFMNAEIPSTSPGLLANYHFNQGVPSGNNSAITTLIDAAGATNTGTLNGIGLNGASSNWVIPGAVANGFTITSPPTATINVSGNGNNIPIGTTTGTLNNTNFGTNTSRTFSISNTSGTLNIGAIYFSGTNAAQFSVTTLPASSITIGGTSFVILHTPSVVGTASAIVHIPSNDCTYPTYSFVITASTSPASALSFAGGNDRVNTLDINPATIPVMTFEAWVYRTGGSGVQTIIGNDNGGWDRCLVVNNGSVQVWAGRNIPTGFTSSLNTWEHYAVTWSSSEVRCIKNGTEVFVTSGQSASSSSLTGSIGGMIAAWAFPFIGLIDEARIWNVARTQCEIQTFMNAEIPTSAPGLIVNYHFNQGLPSGNNTAITTVIDATGINTGTLSGFASTGTISNWVSPGAVANDFTTTSSPSVEINITGNGISISDGDLSPSLTDFTDFGSSSTRTFVIQNTIIGGTLNIGPTSLNGANASDFSITVVPSSSISGIGSTSLVVAFTPTSVGTKTAVITIITSDCDEPVYDFVIQSTGTTASALQFDGVNDVVLTNSNITELAQGDFSIELWMKTTAISQGLVVCTNTNATWEAGEKAFYLDGSGIPVFVGFGNNFIQGNISVNDNNWHHLAVTWDYTGGVSGVGKIYVDGVDQTSGVSYQANNTNIGTFRIGQTNYWASEAPNNFSGSIDEVRIWDRALCQSEISANRNCEITTTVSGLLANYHFNQGLAFGTNSLMTNLTDASAVPITATLSNFGLNGTGSNWVNPGGVTSGSTCSVYIAPEMDVTGNSVSIADNSVLTSTLNFTDFGAAYSRTFAIINSGTSTLGISTPITLTGANATDFSISTQPATVVPVNGTVNFVVSFNPLTIGTKTAQINISNTDCNESPYNYVISGTATAAAALNLDGVNDYANSGNILTASYTKEAWIKILSSANGNNILSNGSGVAGAALWAPGLYNYSISAGHNGTWNAVQGPTLAFSTWYHVAVTYDQPSQTMVLYLNGTSVSSNSNVIPFSGSNPLHIGAFNGTFNMNGSIDEVRIWNRPLCQSEIQNNMNCEIPTTANGLIANYHFNQGVAFGNNTAIINVTDASGNANHALINSMNSIGITSNWETPGAVTTGSTCTVLSVPEINVLGNGLTINDGDISPSLLDHTNFGGLCLGSNIVRTFTIQNIGSSALTVSTVTMSGADAASFSVGNLSPASPIAAGNSAVFSVTFFPGSSGIKSATINIANNDCNESPYDFAVTGTCNALPVVGINVTQSVVCSGFATSLTGTGADTYTWNNGVVNGVAFVPAITQTYSVIGTNTLTGCTSSNAATQGITVNPVPTVTASFSSPFTCFGGTVMLNGSGAFTYTWSPAVPNGIAFAPTVTATYSLVGTSSANCTSTNNAVVTIQVLPLPTLSVNSGSLCSGNSFTLTPSGASTYTYLNAGPIVSPLVNTSYSVIGTSSLGCVSSQAAIANLTVYATPTVIANSGAICNGQTYAIIPTGAFTYTISSGVFTVNPNSTTNYSLTGTSIEGCLSNTTLITVTVNPLPTVTAGASQTLICSGSTVSVFGGGANTYSWSSSVQNNAAFSPTTTATYTVTGTDLNSCANTAAISISVNPLPMLSVVSANSLICSGETTTLTASGAVTYTWNTSANNASIAITLSTTSSFTVSGTGNNSCVNQYVYQQNVDPCAGVVAVVSTYSNVTCKDKNDGVIQLVPNISYSKSQIFYFWTPSELCPDSSCASIKNLKSGDYSVRTIIHYTLSPSYYKTDTILNSFSILDQNPPCELTVYNGLTLNGDGVNDYLYIQNIESYSNNKVTVFNRWGNKLAEINQYNNQSNNWPTAEELKKLESTTYFYIVDPGDGSSVLKGWVEVIKD